VAPARAPGPVGLGVLHTPMGNRLQRRGLLAGALVAAPVACALAYTVAGALGLAGAGASGFSTSYIRAVLHDGAIWRGVVWTVTRSGVATALATAGAALIAAAFREGEGGRRVTDRVGCALAIAPLPIPHLVAATCGVLVLAQSGLVARVGYAVGLVHGPSAVPALVYDRLGVGFTVVLAWKELPFLTLCALVILATRGAALEEVARTLGAGPWDRLVRITLPLLWRGLFPAAAAAFAFIAGSFEGAALLGPSDPLPLPVATLERFNDIDLARRPEAYVVALIALAVATVATVAVALGRRDAPGISTEPIP